MIEIRLDNNEVVELIRKNILLLPPGSRQDQYVNDNYDVIMVIAGVDRKLNLILNRKSILIVEAGVRTSIIVEGPQAENSQVVFIAGVNNSVEGIPRQNRGRIYNMKNEEFDLAAIANFEQITIIK
jgi:hypothetical protein